MLALFDWELKKLLFEESWTFSSRMNVSELRDKIARDLARGDGSVLRSKFGVTVRLSGERITVYSNKRNIILLITLNYYYFIGRMGSEPDGSAIHGEYRSALYRRIVYLIVTNWVLCFIVISLALLVFVPLYLSVRFGVDAVDLSIMAETFIFFGGSVVVGLGFYLLAWIFTPIEKVGRDDIRKALTWIAGGGES